MKSTKKYWLLFILFVTLEGFSQSEKRKLILRDEGLSQLTYVDLARPENNWFIQVPAGRDLQLIGNNKVLIGTGAGYEEREIKTGTKVKEVTSFKGVVAARRLRNGNTLITGLGMEGKKGIVLMEVDDDSKIKRIINFPEFEYVRLVRETTDGTYLITSDTTVFEGDSNGNILWKGKIAIKGSRKTMHAWQALRLMNGQILVSAGFAGDFQIFSKEGKLINSITGPAEVKPYFYSGFQILKNGNYVVANWQGHGTDHGASGTQILEYSPDGRLVWSWKQDPARFSSVQGVIVLDGLDTKYLHVEDKDGKLAPVKNN